MLTIITDIATLEAHYDLAIIGAGPAGMAAATHASKAGARVVLLDENPAAGGQIYRGIATNTPKRRPYLGSDYWKGKAVLQAFQASDATYLAQALVWSVEPKCNPLADGVELRLSSRGHSRILHARRVVFATGAQERPMPVKGWTLPGVMTIGAAQIALKTAGLIPDRGVVLAGTGPLLYMFAAQLLEAGGKIAALLETTPRANWRKALIHLPGFLTSAYAAKGVSLLAKIRRHVPIYTGCSSLQIDGNGKAETIRFQAGGRQHQLDASSIFLHQGVIPNNNLANASGCLLVWNDSHKCFQPQTDINGRSSVPSIFIAGDGGGIGGALVAEVDGAIAALTACQDLLPASAANHAAEIGKLHSKKRSLQRGRKFIDALYLPAQPFRAPTDRDVIVCRCEEVNAGMVRDAASRAIAGPNQLKTQLRCGMGPCQGRMCSATITELLAEVQQRPPEEVGFYRLRAPIKPVPLQEIAAMPHTPAAILAVTGESPSET